MMGVRYFHSFRSVKNSMHRGPSFFCGMLSELRIRRGLFALLSLLTIPKACETNAFGILFLVVYQWCEAALPRGAKGYTLISEQQFFYVGSSPSPLC